MYPNATVYPPDCCLNNSDAEFFMRVRLGKVYEEVDFEERRRVRYVFYLLTLGGKGWR
jgi:hypothetical protein